MDAWKNVGDEVTRLSSIKEKIKKKCGEKPMAWGLARSELEAATIKQLQHQLDILN